MGNEYKLKLVGLTFEQIAATRMPSLDREIRRHVQALAVQDLRLIHDVELDILLTDNMAVQVDRVRQE